MRSSPLGTQRPATQRPATQPVAAQLPASPAPDTPGFPTILTLQECIRALLPPQLAAFCRTFRLAFQVPDSTPKIAGLITEQRHLAWIQHYLTQPRPRPQPKPQPGPGPHRLS